MDLAKNDTERLRDFMAEVTARLDLLEDTVEELRYAGPVDTRIADDLTAFVDTWDDPLMENQFYDD
jgi:hypothetical protein